MGITQSLPHKHSVLFISWVNENSVASVLESRRVRWARVRCGCYFTQIWAMVPFFFFFRKLNTKLERIIKWSATFERHPVHSIYTWKAMTECVSQPQWPGDISLTGGKIVHNVTGVLGIGMKWEVRAEMGRAVLHSRCSEMLEWQ